MGNLMQKSERKAFKAPTKKNTFHNRYILVFDDPPLPNESRSHGRGVDFEQEVLLPPSFALLLPLPLHRVPPMSRIQLGTPSIRRAILSTHHAARQMYLDCLLALVAPLTLP